MTRTPPGILILLALLGAAAGWFVEVWQVALGHPAVVPPWTVAVVLALIGVVIVVYAVPVWRYVTRRSPKRVDPFYATRVVLLAKASSLTGALAGGGAVGILAYLLSRSVIAGVESVSLATAMLAGAAVLVAGGLIAEKMCTLPPDDDQKQDNTPLAPPV